jgi:hypothetical protein
MALGGIPAILWAWLNLRQVKWPKEEQVDSALSIKP